ncbi:MAG: S1 RNA-binding domain-containing protein [Armatimonadetes bacterium]|nr:S1 RNA-binding domain-containing protein [Armatimonadota bacterium]
MDIAEVGQISRGTVIRVLPYGALVRLDDGTLGLVHISEIDDHFVHNVADYVTPNARIVVKVMACKADGKYEFSIKRAKGEVVPDSQPLEYDAPPEIDNGWVDKRETRAAFDEKLRDFLSDSGERLTDLKRHHDAKLHRRSR